LNPGDYFEGASRGLPCHLPAGTSSELLTALHDFDESDWADLHGKPLDARRLALQLEIGCAAGVR
jgi:Protein of unknown function (DUF3631)